MKSVGFQCNTERKDLSLARLARNQPNSSSWSYMKLVSDFISSLGYGLLVYCMLPSALSQTTVFPSPKRPPPLRSWCQTNRISALPPPPSHRPSSFAFSNSRDTRKTWFYCHFIHNSFQASAKAESAPSSHFQKSKILSKSLGLSLEEKYGTLKVLYQLETFLSALHLINKL